jgi:hypothetical protein
MLLRGWRLVAEFESDRLVLASARVERDRVHVVRVVSAARPTGVDPADPAAAGEWLRRVAAEAGIAAAPLVVVVPRGEVVLKRLDFPPLDDAARADLPQMVRLQLSRLVTLPSDEVSVDFIEGPPSAPGESGAAPPMNVLACALPQQRLEWYRAAARSAGWRVAGAVLRSAGAAGILAGSAKPDARVVMGVLPGRASVEFIITVADRLVFSRSVDLPIPETPDAVTPYAERVAVEAKRTVVSARDWPELDRVDVIGSGEIGQRISWACTEALGREVHTGSPSRLIEFPVLADADRTAALGPASVLALGLSGHPVIDFHRPRRAPDRRAAARQQVMLATLLLIVLLGGLAVVDRGRIGRLQAGLASLHDERDRLASEYASLLRSEARLAHLDRWREGSVDWVAHLAALSELLPDPRDAEIDRVSGSLDAAVEFRASSGRYVGGTWSTTRRATLLVDGRPASWHVADALRQRLLDAGLFASVRTRGPDVADAFSIELGTTLAAPPRPEPSP